jgi:mercuric ion transport protein
MLLIPDSKGEIMSQEKTGRLPLIGGVIAAVAASLCCVGPLVLVMLGIGGAWVANLAVLEPFRPYFLGAAVIALFFAWKKIYRAPAAACTPGSLCAMPQTNRIYKVLFWVVAVLVALALIFPYLAPLFY